MLNFAVRFITDRFALTGARVEHGPEATNSIGSYDQECLVLSAFVHWFRQNEKMNS